MFTMDALIAHLVGDYVLQSDWMATEKVKQSVAAAAHALTYTLPFLLITHSLAALAVIAGTHFVIDRWRLARYVCWVKNWLDPHALRWLLADAIESRNPGLVDPDVLTIPRPPPLDQTTTGYGPEKPAWMAVWLLIITDNTMHLLCNGAALHYLA